MEKTNLQDNLIISADSFDKKQFTDSIVCRLESVGYEVVEVNTNKPCLKSLKQGSLKSSFPRYSLLLKYLLHFSLKISVIVFQGSMSVSQRDSR